MDNNFSSRFIKGAMSTGFASLISIMFGFLNIMIAARHVPKEDFGVYILLLVIVSFFIMISDLGLNISSIRFIAGGEKESKFCIFNTVLVFKILIMFFAALLLVSCKTILFHYFKSKLFTEIIFYLPLLFVAESFVAFFSSFLQGLHHFKKMEMASIIMSCVNFILIIIFVVKFDYGLVGLIYSRIIALTSCLLFQIKPFLGKINLKFNSTVFKDILYFGFPLWLNSILTFVFTRVDILLLGALLNPVQVAYYGTASKIPDASRQMFESFRSVYFPHMSEFFGHNRKEDAEILLSNSLRIISFVSLFCTLVVFLFCKEIVRFIFSARYMESAPIISLLMVALSIGLVGNVLGTCLVSAGYSKLPAIINIVDTVVSVTANLVLIPMFGVIGAAYAAILARALTNPVNVWFLKRNGVEVDVRQYIKPAIVFIICVAIYAGAGTVGMVLNLLIIALFVVACMGLSVITWGDLLVFTRCIKYRGRSIDMGT